MTRLFRHDLGDLPPFVDARADTPDVPGAAAVWCCTDAPVPGTRWIAPLRRGGGLPEGARAVALAEAVPVPEAARDLPLHVADPALIPREHRGPIVLAHLASYPCAAEALLAALDRMEDDPRLVLETSGASIANFVSVAAARFPERVVFGSGAPRFDPRAQLMHVASALPDDALLRMVLHDNASRILGGGPHAR